MMLPRTEWCVLHAAIHFFSRCSTAVPTALCGTVDNPLTHPVGHLSPDLSPHVRLGKSKDDRVNDADGEHHPR